MGDSVFDIGEKRSRQIREILKLQMFQKFWK